jgi:L-asparaginase
MNAKKTKKIVVLATGGTIAGLAADTSAPKNYEAGQLHVDQLVEGLVQDGFELVSEQVAQIDSKDMSFGVWQALLRRLAHWLSQDDVQGVVITHGTDTLEETAYFLQRVLQPHKPVALTCAMLPANVPDSDGPENMNQALTWVKTAGSTGVCLVCAGEVHAGQAVQKSHSQLLDPFTSQSEVTHPQALRVPSVSKVLGCTRWPRVELVMNHAGADGRLVRTMTAHDAPDGWVVAGTGNGTLHQDLEAALRDAQSQGAQVWRTSRCAQGGVASRTNDAFPHTEKLTAPQARVALWMHLVAQQA